MNPQILYDIFEKVKTRKDQDKDIIELNVGEPEQKPPHLLFTAINKSLNSGRITYGPAAGDPKLRELLAKIHCVRSENILIGPGSKFLIYAAIKYLLKNAGDELILPLPAWSAFLLMVKDVNKKLVELKTYEKENWQIDLSRLDKVISKNTKAIILTNPNNPTSTLIHRTVVSHLSELAKKSNLTIIKDCAYQDLTFNVIKTKMDLQNTIEIHSFSKKFAMTGFRLGYLIAHSSIIEKLTKFMQITITSVPLFIQDGALELVRKQPSFSRKIAKIYQKRARLVGNLLSKAGISFVKPDAGFYIFANLDIPTEQFCLNLIDKGVAVVPGTAFGPYPTYVRISLTEEEDRLLKGIKIISRKK